MTVMQWIALVFPMGVSAVLSNLGADVVQCEQDWYSIISLNHKMGKSDSEAIRATIYWLQ